MTNLIHPKHGESASLGHNNKVFERYDFADGTTVLSVMQGTLYRGSIVTNPDSGAEHPPTNEQPLVRQLMRQLFKVAVSHKLYGGELQDEPLSSFCKDDQYNDYADSAYSLISEGLLAKNHLDGSPYDVYTQYPKDN